MIFLHLSKVALYGASDTNAEERLFSMIRKLSKSPVTKCNTSTFVNANSEIDKPRSSYHVTYGSNQLK